MTKEKGKLLYKSKTPRNNKIIILFSILDAFIIFSFFYILYGLIIVIFKFKFPESTFPTIYFSLIIILTGSWSVILTFLLLKKLIPFVYIFEKGVEIRLMSLIPLKFKKVFIPYERIKNILMKKGQFKINTLEIDVDDNNVPYFLSELRVTNLRDVKDLIIKYKDVRLS